MNIKSCNEILECCCSARYNFMIYLLLSFTAFKFTYDLSTLSLVTQPEQYRCLENGTTTTQDQCYYYPVNNTRTPLPCTKWSFNHTNFKSSLVTEFNLICDYAFITQWIVCLQFYGQVLGHCLGFLGDIVGRKKYILFCCIWESITTLLIGLIPGLVPYMALRLTRGLSTFIYIQALSLLGELLPSSRRHTFMSAFFILYSFGFITGGLFSYIIRDRRQVILYGLLFNIVYVFYYKLIPESPHWLILKKQFFEARKSLEFMSWISGKKLPEFTLKEEEEEASLLENEDRTTTGNILYLFKTSTSRKKHFVLFYAKCALTLTDLSLIINPTFFSANIFLGAILQGVFEIPAGLLSSILNSHLKRKLSSLITFTISIVLILAVPFSKQSQLLVQYSVPIIIAVLAKMILRTTIATNNIIAAEVFPTVNRSVGMTLWNGTAILTGSVAVWVNQLECHLYWLPQSIYCVSVTVAMLTMHYIIPETSRFPMPNTVEEADKIVHVIRRISTAGGLNLQNDKQSN